MVELKATFDFIRLVYPSSDIWPLCSFSHNGNRRSFFWGFEEPPRSDIALFLVAVSRSAVAS